MNDKGTNSVNDLNTEPDEVPTSELAAEPETVAAAKENLVESEVSTEPVAEPASAPSESTKLDELTRQLEKSKDDYLRLAAEFDNYRKRTNREFASLIKAANEDLIVNLLDVVDNFERAIKSKEDTSDLEAYHKGIKLLYDKLVDTLTREGVKRLECVGQKFDPRFHEAVTQVESAESEPDTVAMELQAGYTLNDKVIRHAKVAVVKPQEES